MERWRAAVRDLGWKWLGGGVTFSAGLAWLALAAFGATDTPPGLRLVAAGGLIVAGGALAAIALMAVAKAADARWGPPEDELSRLELKSAPSLSPQEQREFDLDHPEAAKRLLGRVRERLSEYAQEAIRLQENPGFLEEDLHSWHAEVQRFVDRELIERRRAEWRGHAALDMTQQAKCRVRLAHLAHALEAWAGQLERAHLRRDVP